MSSFRNPSNGGHLRVETTLERSRLMSRVRHFGTTPELAVRKALKGMGVSYGTRNKGLPGTPDLANDRDKWAIFVNGCFWHFHKRCVRGRLPKSNTRFWGSKRASNRKRDKAKEQQLKDSGYRVLIVWECESEDRELLNSKVASFFSETTGPRRVAS